VDVEHAATLRGELLLQHCEACGRWMWPVRFRCIDCMSGEVVWRPASGRGTVYTFTVIHQLFHPGFAAEVPYNVAVIDLDEGVRCYSTMVEVASDDLRIGDPVEVVFERISPEFALPKFRIRTD
jgi:uncharacterized OB-fold protein